MKNLFRSSGSILIAGLLILLAIAGLLSLKTSPITHDPADAPIAVIPGVTETIPPVKETVESTLTPNPYPEPIDATELSISSQETFDAAQSIVPYPEPVEGTPWVPSPSPTQTMVTLPPLAGYPTPGPFKGMKVLYVRLDPPGYYVSDVDGGGETSFLQWWKKDDHSVLGALSYQVSPDGSRILYGVWSNYNLPKPNANAIWVSDSAGSEPRQLVAGNKDWIPQGPIWSPDGQQIAFRKVYFTEPGKSDLVLNQFEIWVVDINGNNFTMIYGNQNMPFSQGVGKLEFFRWCNNGYIYFSPGIPPIRIYALDPNSGTLYPVVNGTDPLNWQLNLAQDGEHMLTSPDTPAETIQNSGFSEVDLGEGGYNGKFGAYGSKVLYLHEDEQNIKIMVRDLITEDKKEIAELKNSPLLLKFSPDGNYVLYKDDKEALFAYNLLTGKTTLLLQARKLNRESNINFIDWIPVQ